MLTNPRFPTRVHERSAEAVVDFAAGLPIQAVLLVNSCARGTATMESDLDVALLIDPELPLPERQILEEAWRRRYETDLVFRELEGLSRFARVHLDFFDGRWEPPMWDDGGGPDAFEIEIGNRVAHSVPLWESGTAYGDLRAEWLPYYGERLRDDRLRMVNDACRLNIERVHLAVGRNLYFCAFDRLYHAFQEFLQALFIVHRVYPIAYNKWIREQIEEWLELEGLYRELSTVLAISNLASGELTENAEHLGRLLKTWASPG